MFTMRIRTPADAVAGAVMLLQIIPEDSLCLIFADTPMALRCDVPNSADDVEAFAVRMRMLAGTYDLSMPVAVVFGTAPQTRESLRTLAAVRDVFTVQMLVRTDTVTCQEYRQESAPGTAHRWISTRTRSPPRGSCRGSAPCRRKPGCGWTTPRRAQMRPDSPRHRGGRRTRVPA